MTHNLNLIKPLLDFQSEDDFYTLQIIKRRKDNPDMNHGEWIIKTVYLRSIEQLDEIWSDLEELADKFDARIYINLNVKSFKRATLKCLKDMADRVAEDNYSKPYKIFDSAAGSIGASRNPRWILDIDWPDPNINQFAKEQYINQVKENLMICEPQGEKVIAEIPTSNGIHLITTPFNRQVFVHHEIDIHKNNPTLAYYKN